MILRSKPDKLRLTAKIVIVYSPTQFTIISQGGFMKSSLRKDIGRLTGQGLLAGVLVMASCLVAALVFAQASAPQISSPLILRSTLENLVRGFIPVGAPPALRIKSGQTVQIETFSHHGFVEDPVAFFKGYGISEDKILPDLIAVAKKLPRPKDGGTHVLTGPVYIDGAEPGDMLEVRILDLTPRVPYGGNGSGPDRGVLPDLLTKADQKIIQLDLQRNVALFSKDIEVPLQPFMGIMAVAPPSSLGKVNSTPPGVYGGNLDLKDLTKGATLFLPVHQPEAQFVTGDGHSGQGDGEVNGTAIETSLAGTFQFILHKGHRLEVPKAETKSHYIVMGLHQDLNQALKQAVRESVKFLREEKKLSASDAYSLASIGVDFKIAEAVDQVQLVVGMIPKRIFKSNPEYWYKE
jgi:acetamidase/formamidase